MEGIGLIWNQILLLPSYFSQWLPVLPWVPKPCWDNMEIRPLTNIRRPRMDRKCGGSPGTSWQVESVTHPVLKLSSSTSVPHPQPETLRSIVRTMLQLLPATDMILVTRVLVVCFPKNLTLWWMLLFFSTARLRAGCLPSFSGGNTHSPHPSLLLHCVPKSRASWDIIHSPVPCLAQTSGLSCSPVRLLFMLWSVPRNDLGEGGTEIAQELLKLRMLLKSKQAKCSVSEKRKCVGTVMNVSAWCVNEQGCWGTDGRIARRAVMIKKGPKSSALDLVKLALSLKLFNIKLADLALVWPLTA